MGQTAIALWLLVFFCAVSRATALSLELKDASNFFEDVSFLPRGVQLSNNSFCLFTTPLQSNAEENAASAVCSTDGGATFKSVKATHSVCTSGVVVEQRLYCPLDELPHDEEGDLEYGAVAFAVQDGEVKEEDTEKRFTFKSGKQTGEIKQILFDGNFIHPDDDDDAHIFVSTIINDAEERKVVFFRSDDGFVFKAVSVVIGVENATAHYLLSEGGRRLSLVSAHSSSLYTSTSSGYAGTFWSAPKTLAVSAPPTSATFSSGALIQYACSNETAKVAKWYLGDDNAKRPILTKTASLPASKEAAGLPLLFFAAASAKDSSELVVVSNEANSKKADGVRVSIYKVDDSAEAKERAEKIAKEREELLRKEAARSKAKMERLERERAQRREQRRKELERKRKFLEDDEPNVRAAKSFMEADGEMIIIRRVERETILLEKEVFFGDL